MSLVYIFGDESGNFDFSNSEGASRYLIITTVTVQDCSIGDDLLELKRQLHWEGYEVKDHFHATDDRQAVRDRVFDLLGQRDFRIDATLLEKAKTEPQLAQDDALFYKTAWFLHLKHLVPKVVGAGDEVFLVAASMKTKGKRASAHGALKDVMNQVAHPGRYVVASWRASTDPCLQVADYCCWAIQKKWEKEDNRSHVLIADKIRSEYDIFAVGSKRYY